MSDIAFLLLIFFLVTTTMDTDQGILVTLPEPIDGPIKPIPKSETLEIFINQADELMVENEEMPMSDLRAEVIKHLNNNGRDSNYSSSAQKAIISLKNHEGTTYNAYLSVYNEIRAGYRIARDEVSMIKYGQAFKNLEGDQRKTIKELYPIRLSEAESVAFK